MSGLEVESSIRNTTEVEPKAYDAVLVHGMWLSQRGDHLPIRPSFRGHLSLRAASFLHDTGLAKNIVFTAGHIWGNKYHSMAEVMAEELIRKYSVPRECVFVSSEGLDSKGEVGAFLELAQEHGWKNLANISARQHLWTIPRLYPRNGPRVDLKATEDILLEKDDKRVQKLVEQFSRSDYEKNYAFYQLMISFFLNFDPNYKILGLIRRLGRTKKADWGSKKRPRDIYRL